MKYIVMECNLSYAVVLDEEGRFFNVANRNYEVGQTTTDVIKMREPEAENQETSQDIDQVTNATVFAKARKMTATRWKYLATAVAACLVIVVASVMNISQGAYASVYMTINPDVRIDISKNETVVGIKGLNKDGETVIEGYDYKKKNVDVVIDELLDRSIEKGFLHEGSKVSLSFDGKNGKWVIEKGDTISKHVEEYLNGKVSAIVQVEKENHASKADPDKKWKKTTSGQGTQGNSDYDEENPAGLGSGTSGNTNYGNTNYGVSSYGNGTAGNTNYGNSNYGNGNSGNTNYGDSNYGGANSGSGNSGSSTSGGSSSGNTGSGNINYGNSDYDDVNDGNSDYGQSDQQKAQEEAARKAEEEAKAREEAEKKAEEEAKRAEEEARKKAEEEEKAREDEEDTSEDGDDKK